MDKGDMDYSLVLKDLEMVDNDYSLVIKELDKYEIVEKFNTGEIAVICNTEEKAEDFLQYCAWEKLRWVTGELATEDTCWSTNKEKTCYSYSKEYLGERLVLEGIVFESSEDRKASEEEGIEWQI